MIERVHVIRFAELLDACGVVTRPYPSVNIHEQIERCHNNVAEWTNALRKVTP